MVLNKKIFLLLFSILLFSFFIFGVQCEEKKLVSKVEVVGGEGNLELDFGNFGYLKSGEDLEFVEKENTSESTGELQSLKFSSSFLREEVRGDFGFFLVFLVLVLVAFGVFKNKIFFRRKKF